MPTARFDILHHPNSLKIYVASGVDTKLARTILRRAVAKRRAIIRDEPRRFAGYLVHQLHRCRQTNNYVAIDTDESPAELVFKIDVRRLGPTLHIQSYKEDTWTYRTVYHGSFYNFVGSELKPYVRHTKRVKRSERLQRFREDYKAKHGYYPEEDNPNKPKLYSPMQKRLQAAHKSNQIRRGKIKLAHMRRKARLTRIKKLGVSPPKPFDIREHYQTPPDSTGKDE